MAYPKCLQAINSIFEARKELIEAQIRIPSHDGLGRLFQELLYTPHKFSVIRLSHRQPQYELPAPTADEPDRVTGRSEFLGVILSAEPCTRWNAYSAPLKKYKLYVLRAGRCMPEILWVSVSTWEHVIEDAMGRFGTNGRHAIGNAMCRFAIERSSEFGIVRARPIFVVGRLLTDAESHYVQALRDVLVAR